MKEETNVRLLPTERLLPNPNQPRKHFDSEGLLELAQSIRENGVLQPLLVRRINNSDYYEIVTGERRLRASILANQQLVPCIEIDCTSQQSATLSIIENIQRRELTFFEEAAAIARLSEVFGMTQEEVAHRVVKSRPAVANALRLLALPDEVRTMVADGKLSGGHARAVLSVSEEDKRVEAAKQMVGLSVRQAESLAKRLNKKPAPKPQPEGFHDPEKCEIRSGVPL